MKLGLNLRWCGLSFTCLSMILSSTNGIAAQPTRNPGVGGPGYGSVDYLENSSLTWEDFIRADFKLNSQSGKGDERPSDIQINYREDMDSYRIMTAEFNFKFRRNDFGSCWNESASFLENVGSCFSHNLTNEADPDMFFDRCSISTQVKDVENIVNDIEKAAINIDDLKLTSERLNEYSAKKTKSENEFIKHLTKLEAKTDKCDAVRAIIRLGSVSLERYRTENGNLRLMKNLAAGGTSGGFYLEMHEELKRLAIQARGDKNFEEFRALQILAAERYIPEAGSRKVSTNPNGVSGQFTLRQELRFLISRFMSDYPGSRFSTQIEGVKRKLEASISAYYAALNRKPNIQGPANVIKEEADRRRASFLRQYKAIPEEVETHVSKNISTGSVEINARVNVNGHVPVKYGLGAEKAMAIFSGRESLQGGLCDCVVKVSGEADAKWLGSTYAQGFSQEMVKETNITTCVQMAKENYRTAVIKNPMAGVDKEEFLSSADWVVVNNCKFDQSKLKPEVRQQVEKVLTDLKEEYIKARQNTDGLSTIDRIARYVVSGLVGGVAWRAGGGGFIGLGNTQAARFLFRTMPFVVLGYWQAGIDGAISGALMFPALVMVGWSDQMDIGHNHPAPGVTKTPGNSGSGATDTVAMGMRGMLQMALPLAYLSERGYDTRNSWLAAFAGMGGGYNVGWSTNAKKLRWKLGNGNSVIDGPTSIGETLSGVGFGSSLALAWNSKGANEVRYGIATQMVERLGVALKPSMPIFLDKESQKLFAQDESAVADIAAKSPSGIVNKENIKITP